MVTRTREEMGITNTRPWTDMNGHRRIRTWTDRYMDMEMDILGHRRGHRHEYGYGHGYGRTRQVKKLFGAKKLFSDIIRCAWI